MLTLRCAGRIQMCLSGWVGWRLESEKSLPIGKLRNIRFSLTGVEGHYIEGVTFTNVHITYPGGGTREEAARRKLPELWDRCLAYMIFGDLVEMGMDMFNPCQPCNDLAGLKRRYGGQSTFIGGIDSQFVLNRPSVTPDEVRAEVRRRIDEMAAGGGYVAAPSQTVPYDPVILAAMNDEIATYGRSCYQQGV